MKNAFKQPGRVILFETAIQMRCLIQNRRTKTTKTLRFKFYTLCSTLTVSLLVGWEINLVHVIINPRVRLHQSVIVEGRVLVLHLENDHTQRPPVTLSSIHTATGGLALQYFGGDIVWSSDCCAAADETVGVHANCSAEICHLQVTCKRQVLKILDYCRD